MTELTGTLRRVGEINEAFPLTTGRGDEARHGGSPDQRGRGDPRNPEAGGLGRKPRDIYVPDLSMGALGAEQEESAAPSIRARAGISIEARNPARRERAPRILMQSFKP